MRSLVNSCVAILTVAMLLPVSFAAPKKPQSCYAAAVAHVAEVLRRHEPGGVLPLKSGGYRSIRELGRGGFGVVSLAQKEGTSERYAIKSPLNEEGRVALEKEFKMNRYVFRDPRAVGRFVHPVRMETTPEGTFAVFEFVRSRSLVERIEDSGSIPEKEAVPIFIQVARSFQILHDLGILHRDVKSENVLITDDGRVLVIDFGISIFERNAQSKHEKDPETLHGSPVYMSPEYIREGLSTRREDLWAFGIMMYEALSGVRPLYSDDIPELFRMIVRYSQGKRSIDRIPGLSPQLEKVLDRLLARKEEDRYQSFSDVIKDLEAIPR